MTVVLHEARLSLDPVPISVRRARHLLRDLLRQCDRTDWLDVAEIALSEVVTNAVLHGHTVIDLRATVSEHALRVEVHDDNPQLPVQRGYEVQATTGRGMDLVAALTGECGVARIPSNGKVVWFVVPFTRDALPGEQSEADLLAAWEVHTEPSEPAEAGTSAPVAVALKAMPPMLWLAARQHHDAILREYALYGAEHGSVDVEDVALADRARSWISAGVVAALEAALQTETPLRGLPEGHRSPLPAAPSAVDLQLTLPADAQHAFLALQDVLDAAERLAVADLLLVRPALPEIVALRDWACEQVIAQLSGVAASAWPGTDQEHFTEQVHGRDREPAEWDDAVVRTSDRQVVAADEANRIVAVSWPLAEALGWTVDDLVGRRVVALIPPSLREAHVAGFSRHLTTGEAHVLGLPLRLPVLRADGTEVMADFLIEAAPASGGRRVYLAWMSVHA